MAQLKKTFVVTMFGKPFDWMPQFVEHVQHLEKHGWYWKIFTPDNLESKGNVEFIKMDTGRFNDLVGLKLGVKSNFFITESGVPSVHVTDYYVASGVLFEDWLRDSDFWGIANLDIVVGNLSKFLPDDELDMLDVWTDDSDSFNGTFSLMRNTPLVNNLFKSIPNWQEKLSQPPCEKCVTGKGSHSLFGTDEYDMTEVLKQETVRYGHPEFYPLHSHDRLEQHVPEPKLELRDGALYELFKDINGPQWIHARPFIGHEIMWYHFQKNKVWPIK